MKSVQILVCLWIIFVNTRNLDAFRLMSFKDHIAVFPCEGSGVVVEDFKLNQPPDDENKYELYIDTDRSKGLPVNSTLQMKFDSFANVSLNHDIGNFRYLPLNRVVMISHTLSHGFINMTVRGRRGRPVPNLLVASLNYVDLCPNGYSTGHWDKYIVGDLPRCGRRQNPRGTRTKRVTHGFEAKAGDWPWHVAILKKKNTEPTYICGGCLISPSRVLTAGHCVTEYPTNVTTPQLLLVQLGINNLALGGDEGILQEKMVDQIIRHPSYNTQTFENNIAMLVLSSDVIYGQYVQPVCLWQKNRASKETIVDKIGHVVGWGFNEKQMLTNRLNQATTIVASDQRCLLSVPLSFATFLHEDNYCAGYRNGTGVCNGDSGGGMYFPQMTSSDEVETWYLRGIISLRKRGRCDASQYALFTDTAFHLDWIEQNMK